MVRFKCLASGSSGNCYYIESEEGALLIDAGIPARVLVGHLSAEGIGLEDGRIKGVLVTHDHADHVRSVGVLATRYGLPIYANEAVHRAIGNNRFVSEDITAYRRVLEPEQSTSLAGFEVTAFAVPHDSAQNQGYHLTRPQGFAFTLATDVGHVTPTLEAYAHRAKHLVVEANYDRGMLLLGHYPPFLKDRITSPSGHLSNDETADLLARIYHLEMKNIWLCHLSKDNNHPDMCYKTIERRLFDEGIRVGIDCTLTTLKRTSPSPMYILEA